MKLRPLFDRVLIKPIVKGKWDEDIIVSIEEEKTQQAIVHTLGTGPLIKDAGLKEGQVVLYNKYAGEPYKFDKVEYLLIEATEITAILEED
jgi:chaperonin GroES